jgi:hypothetical protein
MNLDPSQLAAIELMRGGNNVFLTGMAGTGKSTVTGEFVGSSFEQVELTATTGVAALNLRDQLFARTKIDFPVSTIFRWAGMQIGPKPGQSFEDFYSFLESGGNMNWKAAYRRIQRCEVLVIDEISMLPGRLLDYLDWHCRRIRATDKPFGGIRVVAVGDFLQLPPVSKTGVYDWAFASRAWEEAGFQAAVLERVHRQSENDFLDVLADLREGRVRGKTAHILKGRVARFPPRDLLRLFTHNSQVDKWNEYQLGNIEAEAEVFEAKTKGNDQQIDFLRKNLVTPEVLEIKPGARVMITRNLTQDGDLIAVNGQTGVVERIEHEAGGEFGHEPRIIVRPDGASHLLDLGPATWTFDPQDQKSATFTQYPLRLAWAATIHKTQGLSLPAAMADIRAAREPGQAYVAVSRVKTLDGLHLKDWFSGIAVSDTAIRFHRNLASGRPAALAV